MSDKKFSIGIETTADTTGAKQAEKSIEQMEAEVKSLQRELKGLPVGSKEFANLKTEVDGAKRSLADAAGGAGKLGDAVGKKSPGTGAAVLELSRGLEDLQYGVRGVLNNIPQLALALGGGAGLAGVISIVAVGASALWTALGDEKKTDAAAASINKVKDAIDTFKKAINEIKEAERLRNTKDQVEAYEDQKTAIDSEAAALKASNLILRDNIAYREKLAALDTRDALADIDTKEKSGKITPVKASQERAEVNSAAVTGSLLREKETADVEVAAVDIDRRAATAKTEAAAIALAGAVMQRDARAKEIADMSQQLKLRANLDKQREALIPQQQKAFTDAAGFEDLAASAAGQGNSEQASLYRQQALDNLQRAKDLWNDIQAINQRITREAPKSVKSYEITGQDGTARTVDANKKKDQLISGVPGVTPSYEELEGNVKTLDTTLATTAKQANDLTDSLRLLKERVETNFNNSLTLSARDNPALGSLKNESASAGAKTSSEVEAVVGEVNTALGKVAEQPAVKGMLDRVRALASDGLQAGEQQEFTALVGQLVQQIKGQQSKSNEFFQKLISIMNTSATKQADFDSQIQDLKRAVEKLGAAANQRNP